MINACFDATILRILNTCDRLHIGFSGGLDSTVLLHYIANHPQINVPLHAIHVNHGLSAHSGVWQEHCANICASWCIAYDAKCVTLQNKTNLEARARAARYGVFRQFIQAKQPLLTAHHQDDQVETILLAILRGAGLFGLQGMLWKTKIGQGDIYRPFLACTRQTLLEYAQQNNLQWIEDESNHTIQFARNFLRHKITPVLSQRWPQHSSNWARTAALCEEAVLNLQDLAWLDCPELRTATQQLSITSWLHLSTRRRMNILITWLQQQELQLPGKIILHQIMHELIDAKSSATPMISWANIVVMRYQEYLYILHKDDLSTSYTQCVWAWPDFPNLLCLSAQHKLYAQRANTGVMVPDGSILTVKLRRGGEVLRWHAQTKTLKKLMQTWGIPPWRRQHIPLIYIGQELACVVGYAISDLYYIEQSDELAYQFYSIESGVT